MTSTKRQDTKELLTQWEGKWKFSRRVTKETSYLGYFFLMQIVHKMMLLFTIDGVLTFVNYSCVINIRFGLWEWWWLWSPWVTSWMIPLDVFLPLETRIWTNEDSVVNIFLNLSESRIKARNIEAAQYIIGQFLN